MRPRRLSFRRAAVLLALAAGLHGLVYVPLVSTNEKTDTWPYAATANAIVDGSYSTPLKASFYFVYPQGWFDITGARIAERAWEAPERQVFRPPGYPAYLALFGERQLFAGDHTAVLLGHGLLFGLGALLLIATVRRWWGENVALLGGLLYALDPWSKRYVALVLSETLATTVLLAGIYALTRAWQSRATTWWVATGALFGGLALVRAVFVLLVPVVALAALAAGGRRAGLRHAAAAAAASAFLIVPWLAWVHSVVGRPTMSVWGQGYNLILAASGEGHGRTAGDVEADPDFQARMDHVRARVPSADELMVNPTAHPRYLSDADETVRADAKELYRERLSSEPLQVGWDALYRMWFLWNVHKDWYQPAGAALTALRALDWLTLALAALGSVLAFSRGGPPRAVLALLAAYTFVLGVHHVEARFGMPFRGVVLALVGLALATGFGRLRRG